MRNPSQKNIEDLLTREEEMLYKPIAEEMIQEGLSIISISRKLEIPYRVVKSWATGEIIKSKKTKKQPKKKASLEEIQKILNLEQSPNPFAKAMNVATRLSDEHNERISIIHGQIRLEESKTVPSLKRITAWIELKKSRSYFILDLDSLKIAPKSEWRIKFKPSLEIQYSLLSAQKLKKEKEHCGPWLKLFQNLNNYNHLIKKDQS